MNRCRFYIHDGCMLMGYPDPSRMLNDKPKERAILVMALLGLGFDHPTIDNAFAGYNWFPSSCHDLDRALELYRKSTDHRAQYNRVFKNLKADQENADRKLRRDDDVRATNAMRTAHRGKGRTVYVAPKERPASGVLWESPSAP